MKVNEITIRSLMYQKKITQRKLSQKTELSERTINRICNGMECRYDTAKRISDALSVKVDDIKR